MNKSKSNINYKPKRKVLILLGFFLGLKLYLKFKHGIEKLVWLGLFNLYPTLEVVILIRLDDEKIMYPTYVIPVRFI